MLLHSHCFDLVGFNCQQRWKHERELAHEDFVAGREVDGRHRLHIENNLTMIVALHLLQRNLSGGQLPSPAPLKSFTTIALHSS